MFRGDPVPPSPEMTGVAAQNAAWKDDISRGREGGAPTFKPLVDAQKALKAAQAQPKVEEYDRADMQEAKTALAKAQSDWAAIATRKKPPVAKLETIAENAHRAQRLAEIAQYTAQSKINADQLVAVRQQLQQARQRSVANVKSAASGVNLVGQKVVPDRLGRIAFEPGTAKITSASHAVVGRLATLLKQHPEYGIAIFAFTDNSAPDASTLQAFMQSSNDLAKKAKTHRQKVQAYHLALSSARARDVALLLVHQGVDPGHIGARGLGEQHPVASNETAAGRRANRRLEAIIVPAPKNGQSGTASQ